MGRRPEAGRRRRKGGHDARSRPRPLRQLMWVAIALAGIAVGFGIGLLFPGADERSPRVSAPLPPPPSPARAWYRDRPPPPALITAPDRPLLPEPDPDAAVLSAPPRAYEESLPREVYIPPATPAAAPPKAKPDASPEAVPVWRRLALAPPPNDGRPRIAIVIDDLGVDRKRSARAIALPAPLTMAFLAYAPELERQTAAARAAGHELLVHVPMQPRNDTLDPGPNVLAVDLAPEQLRRRLDWGLTRFTGFVGINNHMGSRFTAHAEGMAVVMEDLRRRGLLFLDSRTTGGSVGAAAARRQGVPYAVRNVFLDNENDVAAVNARLGETEAVARRLGLAVAIGHPRDATIKALAPWLADIDRRGFTLVPISATVRLPEGSG